MSLKIALAQFNPHEGQIDHNLAAIRALRGRAADMGADLLVTPEFSIAGYPPEDLVRKTAFVERCEAALASLAADTVTGPGLIVGGPWRDRDRIYNAAFVMDGGRITGRVAKCELPNYGVFDDKRVFDAGPAEALAPVDFRGTSLGLMICEDWWFPAVSRVLADAGAAMLLSINGSPFECEKTGQRIQLAQMRVAETGLPFVFCNQVCGQDELVFDGAGFVLNGDLSLAVQLPSFAETLVLTEWASEGGKLVCAPRAIPAAQDPLEETYGALMLGLRDYVRKNGFPGIILGLSGGIDSALSAAVAVDALGRERVRAVMLPSPYTSRDSLEDAAECAELLGIRYDTIAITPAMQAFDAALAVQFEGTQKDITEENIQSRARGLILMALSNKFGQMVLTTGNKSEMSVGYATLYGDMCGGYSVLKDVYKTQVFALSVWRNAARPAGALGPEGPVMPERVITKPPSAELKPDQTDQDSLPPYDTLDAILAGLVEGEKSVNDLVSEGFERDTVIRVWKMLDRAEYKRRQAPPGVKISARAFGRDRRYPITNGFTGLMT
jgi:NAD+ synthase